MTKTFDVPFGQSGDLAPVPNATQPDGTVSYTQGFGPEYAADQKSDPNALDIPRPETNQVLNDITDALKQYQTDGVYDYDILLKPYNLYSHVRFDDGLGVQVYESLAATNNALPTDTTKWRVISDQYSVTPASIQQSQFIYDVNSGTSNALITTILPAYGTLQPGMVMKVKVISANTGAVTLNGDAVGVMTPLGLLPCVRGELQPGVFDFTYVDVGSIKWMLANPATLWSISAQVDFSGTQTVNAGTTTKILFNTVNYDPFSMWDAANHWFIAPLIGKYRLYGYQKATSAVDDHGLSLGGTMSFTDEVCQENTPSVPTDLVLNGGKILYASAAGQTAFLNWLNGSGSNVTLGGGVGGFEIQYIGN